MPRRTRNSSDAALPACPQQQTEDPSSPSVMPSTSSERQAFIQEIAQVVMQMTQGQNVNAPSVQPLVADSELPSTSHPPQPQGMSNCNMQQSLPEFVRTFTLPNANSDVPTAAISMSGPISDQLPTPLSVSAGPQQVSPILHQPFILGPGCSPIPAKLVSQIASGKFVNLGELLSADLTETDEDPRMLFDGRLVLAAPKKRVVRSTADILSWVEAFSIFMTILSSFNPQRWRDLSLYKLLIIRTYRQFSGFAWSNYDKAFREHAAASQLSDWSGINTQLYSFHTAGAAHRQKVFNTTNSRSNPYNNARFCYKYNDSGQCKFKDSCNFSHTCSNCRGNHSAVNCHHHKGQ